MLAVTGVDWLIAARTPFPRLRASNNLVVPEDKVPKDSNGRAKAEPANDGNNQNNNPTPDNNPPAPETTVTYVCFSSSVGRYWSSSVTGGVTNIALATRRTASSDAARDCSGLTVGMTFMSSTSPVNVSS